MGGDPTIRFMGWRVVATVLCLAIVLLFVATCDTTETIGRKNQESGTILIAAIEKYRSDHGTYPPNLTALVPKYVNRVRPPKACEGGWIYELKDEGRNYALGFRGKGRNYTGFYDSRTKEWWIDDK